MNIILLSNLDANIEIILHVYNIIRKTPSIVSIYYILYLYNNNGCRNHYETYYIKTNYH